MAFNFRTLKRSLSLFTGGIIALVMMWYFKNRQRKRNYKLLKNKPEESITSLPGDQTSSFDDKSLLPMCEPFADSRKTSAQEAKNDDSDKNSTSEILEGSCDLMIPDTVAKEDVIHCTTGSGSHTTTSSFVSSLTSSEHEADLEEMVGQNKIVAEKTKQTFSSERNLDLETEEASFSWSKEVEDSAKKKTFKEEEKLDGKNKNDNANCEPTDGYNPAESPAGHSEHGSQDSGRATGGPASSLSPAQDSTAEPPFRPMYEFEIPNSLVGLIIGIKGKTIRELCKRTDVKMIIRPHHTPNKISTHQICTVEGPRDNINKCLQMLRRRFPATRFPELNLKPVLPPPLASADIYGAVPTQLSLPEGVRCDVLVSAYVDAGHFFIQQPTHPAFPSLHRLDCYMLAIYSQTNGIPDLPRPCETGLLCVAPAPGGWYRAVTIFYYEEEDEVLVRFVDYGGYSRVPRADLRQIRTDFMTLPFQAVECLLAHVEPVDGSSTWYPEANELFEKLAMGRILEAFVVGYSVEDQTPIVELFTVDKHNMAVRIDRALLDVGLAKASDPSKVKCVPPKPMVSPIPVQPITTTDSVSTVSTQSTTGHA